MSTVLQILVLIATLPAVGSLVVLAITRAADSRDRRREMFARAYAACQAYREFPYVVRRRGKSDPEAERLRISSELRQVQQELAFCVGWMTTESKPVAQAYRELVGSLRAVAGVEIRKAWEEEAVRSDCEMSMTIDLSGIGTAEEVYLSAVRRRLSLMGRRTSEWTSERPVRGSEVGADQGGG